MTRSQLEIVSARTALLVMDIQDRIVANYTSDPGYLARLQAAVAAARQAKVKVIHVALALRSGSAEVSVRNQAFSGAAATKAFTESDPGAGIHRQMQPAEGESVVTKRRVSAFCGSDLDLILRANDIDTLVLAGIATSGVVLSTLRQAADMDYRLLVLADGCADSDEEVHRVLLTKIFPRQATVLSIAEWSALLVQPRGG